MGESIMDTPPMISAREHFEQMRELEERFANLVAKHRELRAELHQALAVKELCGLTGNLLLALQLPPPDYMDEDARAGWRAAMDGLGRCGEDVKVALDRVRALYGGATIASAGGAQKPGRGTQGMSVEFDTTLNQKDVDLLLDALDAWEKAPGERWVHDRHHGKDIVRPGDEPEAGSLSRKINQAADQMKIRRRVATLLRAKLMLLQDRLHIAELERSPA